MRLKGRRQRAPSFERGILWIAQWPAYSTDSHAASEHIGVQRKALLNAARNAELDDAFGRNFSFSKGENRIDSWVILIWQPAGIIRKNMGKRNLDGKE